MLKFLEKKKEEDISCKSLIFKVQRGMLTWAVSASRNTLATPDILARSGKLVDSRHKVFDGLLQQLLHAGRMLSACSKSKYRHDYAQNDTVMVPRISPFLSSN